MSIEITTGGVTKTYRYYPYDAFYVDGVQVREAWFNNTKYYPDDYPNGFVAVRGIERHPAGVSHPMPSPRYTICGEVLEQGAYELAQYAMGSYEISWAYLGKFATPRVKLSDVIIPSSGGGFLVKGKESTLSRFIQDDQYIARIKYTPNMVNRDILRADGQEVFDKITNGEFLAGEMKYRNDAGARLSPNIVAFPESDYYTTFKIEVKLDYNDGTTEYNYHRKWRVVFYVKSDLSNGTYITGHERQVELFEPSDTSLLSASDLLPL